MDIPQCATNSKNLVSNWTHNEQEKTMEQSREFTRQELLEQEMIDSGVNRYKRSIERARKGTGKGVGVNTQSLESNTSYGVGIVKTYIADVSRQIVTDTAYWIDKVGRGRKPLAWKYLEKLDPDTCAFITIKTIVDNISGMVKLSTLVHRIASKIEDQTRLDLFQIQDKKYYQATQKYVKEKKQAVLYRDVRKGMLTGARLREDIIRPWIEWPIADKVHIGNALLEAFIKVTSDYDQDGHRIIGTGFIEKSSHKQGKKTVYMISGTAKASEWIAANQEVCQYFSPDFMPCVEPPMNWTSPTYGGFHTRALQKRKPLVKMQQNRYLKDMAAKGVESMQGFYNAVNTLQETPWEINTFVYNQMVKEFKAPNGVGMPGLVPKEQPAMLPFMISQGSMSESDWKSLRKDAAKLWTKEQKQQYGEWVRANTKYKREEGNRVSEVLTISRTLNTARRFAFEDKFYFVWTADFRGRLYACGTAITPQGNDKSKGVLKFHEGVPLGKNGLYHLCVHAAGVYGNDKGTLEDRIAWVMQNKEAFIQTYKDPDSTRDFWKSADKPYCFLGVCEELGQVLALPAALQESFVSHIPCAQDGSCNGIQHYSAMLRDVIGAHSVNLTDFEIPADIYMKTANRVIEYIHKTINENVSFDGHEWHPAKDFEVQIAKGWLEFGIARDCTKKPTMVIPYGGTKIGCRDQCHEYLDTFTKKKLEADPGYVNPFVDLETFGKSFNNVTKQDEIKQSDPEVQAITWLHHVVWLALDDIVVAARKAMKFLRQVMSAIQGTTKEGTPVQFTSYLGFPVYFDVRKTELYRVDSHLEGRIQLALKRDIDLIDKRKMSTGIAPDFVHMLDASHMQLIVNMGKIFGITSFACIHDSAGTHAGRCDILHKVIRHTFVELHEVNALVRFLYECMSKHPDAIPKMPSQDDVAQGDFDLNEVLTARHFFR